MSEVFTTGKREIDKLIGEIPTRYMLLIVGHPGAGKTVLASQICYANTLKGYKCLYISFYEDKEKLFRNMNRLGINLAEAEWKGLLTHVKLPTTLSNDTIDTISDLIAKDSYRVVVIDSLNPIMEFFEQREQRAILLNFFYNIIDVINGLLVALAEIPLGKESLDLGSIEFVSDSIIYLKHRVSRGLVSRVLEVRKIRGSPLVIAEVPFDIVEKEGLDIHAPPRPERPLSTLVERLRAHEVVTALIGPLYRGDIVTINYPPYARDKRVNIPTLDIVLENDMKTLIMSYKYSRSELREIAFSLLTRDMHLDPSEANWVIDNYIDFESFNPAAYSISQLATLEIRLIEKHNPDMVLFHGCEIPWMLSKDQIEGEYWSSLINQLIWLKNQGKLVVRLLSRVNSEVTNANESLSDVVIRVYYKHEGETTKMLWKTWRRGGELTIVEFTKVDVQNMIKELSKVMKRLIYEKRKTK